MVGDDFYQLVYIPDESNKNGVYVFNPDGTPFNKGGQTKFGGGGIFNADEEGVLVYTCPADGLSDNGEGLIVVSDQINSSGSGNDYEVFSRKTWEHLGKIKLKDKGGNFVYNTDGIASTQQSSSQYSMGIFAAIDHDTSTVGVDWSKILAATGLSCDGGSNCAGPADLNCDGLVNAADLRQVLSAWGSSSATEDLHSDGKVNALDLAFVLLNWKPT